LFGIVRKNDLYRTRIFLNFNVCILVLVLGPCVLVLVLVIALCVLETSLLYERVLFVELKLKPVV